MLFLGLKVQARNYSADATGASSSPAAPPERKREKISPISWRSVGLSLTVGGLMLAFMLYVKREKELGKYKCKVLLYVVNRK